MPVVRYRTATPVRRRIENERKEGSEQKWINVNGEDISDRRQFTGCPWCYQKITVRHILVVYMLQQFSQKVSLMHNSSVISRVRVIQVFALWNRQNMLIRLLHISARRKSSTAKIVTSIFSVIR